MESARLNQHDFLAGRPKQFCALPDQYRYNVQTSITNKIEMLEIQKNKDVIEQVRKLSTRIDNLEEIKNRLFQYLLRTQQLFEIHCKQTQTQIENFEDTLNRKSSYSIGKCHSMKKIINVYRHMLNFVGGVAKLNEVDLAKIDIASTKKQEAVKKKADGFIKAVSQYSSNQQGYNKDFSEYESYCNKIDELIARSKIFQDPINFYSVDLPSDFSRKLDKHYRDCESKETSLASHLQLLDEKRKLLCVNLKDIQYDYINLLHYHMTNIVAAVECLTDSSKDEMHAMSSTVNIEKTENDVFSEEIQRFDIKYGKTAERQDELFQDLKELFKTGAPDVQISSDERLFLDRCETFCQKKYESVEEYLYLQKRFYEEILNQVNNCNKVVKQFSNIQKSVFKSNGIEDYKKRIRKYLGDGILNISQLCFVIVDVPKRRFEKIGKMLASHEEKLKRILQRKDEQFKKFKKRICLILSEHTNASRSVESNNIVSINKFKSNIQKTFAIFKQNFEEFTRNQSSLDQEYDETIKKVVEFIERQSKHCLLKYTLSKEKEKYQYNIFKKFSCDNQIVGLVKQDTRYEVLFSDSLKPCLFNEFKSLINKKNYEETKEILKRKKYQASDLVGQKTITCCGIKSDTVKRYKTITQHQASLVAQQQQRNGVLEVLDKGIKFDQKSKNPFGHKASILIPIKQISSFLNKNTSTGSPGIEIITNMGAIFFVSPQLQDIEDSLQKNLSRKISLKDQHNDSRNKSSDSSSIFKQNNTSTQYKISFEKSVIANEVKPYNTKLNEALLLKKFKQQWQRNKIFSQFFVIQTSHKNLQFIRFDYKFKDDVNKFLLREKKSFKIISQNSFILNFDWKISFPDMPMLKSFTHGQLGNVNVSKNLVSISITERARGESHLFMKKTFYSEVDKMNKKLCDMIFQVYQRQVEVVIDQEKPQNGDEDILLDVQNFTEDHQSKSGFGLIRQPSNNIIVESQKGSRLQATGF